jgi:hypothetical protein
MKPLLLAVPSYTNDIAPPLPLAVHVVNVVDEKLTALVATVDK